MNKEPNVIVSNQVECLICHDRPFSASVHDFVSCKCGAISVDGGQEYLRRVGKTDQYKELSITLPKEVILQATAGVVWAQENNRNHLGIAYAVIRGMRDGGFDFNEKQDGSQ